jgi:tRNA uridine 5-carbamoylmethylation protein Kti12
MLIFIIKFAKRGKKYNSAYDDEEVQDELNQRKIEAKKSGKKFIEENKTEIKIDKPIKKSVLHKFKKDTKVNSEKEPSITKSVIDEDEEALKG